LGVLAGHVGYAAAAWSNDQPGTVAKGSMLRARLERRRQKYSEAMTLLQQPECLKLQVECEQLK
jgi:hypothetical protein